MNDEDRKRLTEYMDEDWRPNGLQRTFATRDDMYDLYGVIFREGKWEGFAAKANLIWFTQRIPSQPLFAFHAWLFCLSGEGYEDRCQLVVDWRKGERKCGNGEGLHR